MSSSRKRTSASQSLLSSSAFSSSRPPKSRRTMGLTFPNVNTNLPPCDDCGDCSHICEFCSAFFWYAERVVASSTVSRPCYTHCCKSGLVVLPFPLRPPDVLSTLYGSPYFRQNIRAYNSMFAMTSFRAEFDDNINKGDGPYVFKVSGQISHWIGSLCPEDDKAPTFLQLYIVDTENEMSNRLSAFEDPLKPPLDENIVTLLMEILSLHNEYVRTFRTARELAFERELDSYAVCLFNHVPDRRYGPPAPGSLGCIIYGDYNATNKYDIVVFSKSGNPQRVSKLHPSYMALQYPLLFPYGEDGWSPRLKLLNETGVDARNLTVNMYYSYQIHARNGVYSLVLNACRLFQQYLVDTYTCVEQGRLDYIQNNQERLRSDYVSGIYDALSRGDLDGRSIGKRVLLPPSFVGGPRYMYSHYQDALSICREYGNPQYFITFTCNVNWPEIRRYIFNHNQNDMHSRAAIISRVFHIKVKAFIKYLKEDKTFGDVATHLYTIEFQKKGLPHCHTLLWVTESHKIREAPVVDMFISAELPDPISEPSLHQTVTSCMIHGPCGLLNLKAPCMKDGKCSKHYPKPFHDSTAFDKQGYAHYRRNCFTRHTLQNGIEIDNGYIVPYNKRLCSRFNAHINVEYCGWNMMIRYLFKYVSKGMERVKFVLQKDIRPHECNTSSQPVVIDEIQSFLDGRYICPHEAAWRILNFPIHERDPPVMILPVHLPNMQTVYFKENNQVRDIVKHPAFDSSLLLGWFENNKRDKTGLDLTYAIYPSKYVWNKESKRWKLRDRTTSHAIGRLVFVHPSAGELFYLRMLLCHQKGCKSYEDVHTVSNCIYPNYRSACEALGLIGEDKEWLTAFTHASEWATSSKLRSLFCHLLIFCEVSNPMSLWEAGWRKMSDDLLYNINKNSFNLKLKVTDLHLQQLVLVELEKLLQSCTPSKSVTDFHLPLPSKEVLTFFQNRLLLEETSYDKELLHSQHKLMVSQLNADQLQIYNDVLSAQKNKKQVLIFVYGHGGAGKTFLWTTLLSYLRSIGKVALAVAASGIASLLLPSGRTAHSRFNIPIDLSQKSACDIKKKTMLAALLKETSIIIWDEAPMSDKHCFECLDRSLIDILESDTQVFGGIYILLGGDFHQTLPVCPKSTRCQIIGLTLPNSYLWPCFKVYKLRCNMRLMNDNIHSTSDFSVSTFASWLLDVGDGNLGEPDETDIRDTKWIKIPPSLIIPAGEKALQNLIQFVYGDGILTKPCASSLSAGAIVCPKNNTTHDINNFILNIAPCDEITYKRVDMIESNSNQTSEFQTFYPPEYLNHLNFPSIPPHKLVLKINTPIMLIRNLNQREGLCNGTRLMISQLLPVVIEATIITGTSIGKRVYLPRIKFIHKFH